MAAPPYMKLFIADYLGDTTHLSTLEHGAYMLLLMAMWRAGGSLPADDVKLAKLARMGPDQWAETRSTILDFFRRRGGSLGHKRIAFEMARYENVSVKRKKASEMGVIAKRQKNSTLAEPDGDVRDNRLVTKPEPEPELKKESPLPPPKGTRGGRLNADWLPTSADRAYAADRGFSESSVDRTAETFRDYWLAKAGGGGVKLDWAATWRTWVRREAERNAPRKANGQVDWC